MSRWLKTLVIAVPVIAASVLTPLAFATTHAPGSPTGIPGFTLPPGYTLLATPLHAISGFKSPGGPKDRNVPDRWHNEPITMPVILVDDGYYKVRLPGRPNGSTTWVKASQVLTGETPYQIVIDVKATHLRLYFKGKQILNAPVGVGTKSDPTPIGHFFVSFFAAPPIAGYGPFIMVTSAHSNSITDWEDSGDAMVAIHGPLGEQAAIGTKGARVSHGCIRMQIKDQGRLRVVPVGTPVNIVN
jgi:lipoprotein-anchoring transpeptidase ErfK/SrfK